MDIGLVIEPLFTQRDIYKEYIYKLIYTRQIHEIYTNRSQYIYKSYKQTNSQRIYMKWLLNRNI